MWNPSFLVAVVDDLFPLPPDSALFSAIRCCLVIRSSVAFLTLVDDEVLRPACGNRV